MQQMAIVQNTQEKLPSGGTVTFTLTEGMDWRQNPPVHVTLTTPIVFTAANWVTNMTDGSGWNRGMHFWDPDANQGYNIRYTSFQNPTSDSNANAVKQRTRTKIALQIYLQILLA